MLTLDDELARVWTRRAGKVLSGPAKTSVSTAVASWCKAHGSRAKHVPCITAYEVLEFTIIQFIEAKITHIKGHHRAETNNALYVVYGFPLYCIVGMGMIWVVRGSEQWTGCQRCGCDVV